MVSPAAGDRIRVLVVDDDPMARLLLRAVLERAGFDVVEAPHADGALAALGETAVRAVLVDLHMPGVDGAGLCRALRARPRGAALPIVVVTGEEDEAPLARALEAGADDVVRKPPQGCVLARRLRNLVELYALRAAASTGDGA